MSLQMADRELRLSNNALHLSFNFFDRYLGLMLCGERNLQLVSTACMWIALKIEGSTKTAAQLEKIIGIDRKQIVEMERWLLSALRWEVQPVTTFEVVRLLLPFTFCEREHRAQLAKYCEHITLAQALVYPLLKYEPTVLAVTSIVCAAYLVSSVFDEHLNAGLAALVGAPLERTWQCRRDVQTHISLPQLRELLH